MTSDPSNICSAPINVITFIIKNILLGRGADIPGGSARPGPHRGTPQHPAELERKVREAAAGDAAGERGRADHLYRPEGGGDSAARGGRVRHPPHHL